MTQQNPTESKSQKATSTPPNPVEAAITAYDAIRRALKDPNPRWIIP